MRIALPLLLISVAACTQTPRDLERQATAEAGTRAALDKELAGLVPGRPQDCVEQTLLRGGLHSYGDTLVYRGAGTTRYVTQTSGGCGRVGDDSYIVTSTPTTQLCRGDIARAVDRTSNFPSGSCSFGAFVPYSRAPR